MGRINICGLGGIGMARTASEKKAIHPNNRALRGRRYTTYEGLSGGEGIPARLRRPRIGKPEQTFEGVQVPFSGQFRVRIISGQPYLVVSWTYKTREGKVREVHDRQYLTVEEFTRCLADRVRKSKGGM